MTDPQPSSAVGTTGRTSPLLELTLARLRLYFREPGAVFWSFGFPLLITVALGVAFRSRPPSPVSVAVVESEGAAALAAALPESGFRVSLLPAAEARAALRVGRVAMVIVPGNPRTYEFDPTREESRLGRLLVDDALQRAAGRADPVSVTDYTVSEPGARYIDFLVPGLIGLNIMSSGMWGIAYVIVETRMRKLLKRMVATPMRRSHFLLSFLLMRLAFLVVELPVLLGFAYLVFSVPVRGSIALLSCMATLGALAFSGIGLLIASRAENTQTVGGLINLIQMPMFIGSGVFFSVGNFPEVVQPVLRLLPLTALNDALRAIMNEGAGMAAVAPQAALLLGVTVVCFALALRLFRWT